MTLQSERTRGVQPERPQQPNSIENPTGHVGACADTAVGCLPKRDMGPLEVSTWKMRETGNLGGRVRWTSALQQAFLNQASIPLRTRLTFRFILAYGGPPYPLCSQRKESFQGDFRKYMKRVFESCHSLKLTFNELLLTAVIGLK